MEEDESLPVTTEDCYIVSNSDLLLEGLSVNETLEFSLKMGGGYISNVDEALAMIQLESVKENDVGLLSTGERRRLSIAEAILSSNQTIEINEWNRGLDSETSNIVYKNIINHVATSNRRILLSTSPFPRPTLLEGSNDAILSRVVKPCLRTQLYAILQREFRIQTSQYHLQLRLVRFIPHALLLGLLFGKIKNDQSGSYDFLGLLFNLMSAVSLGSLSALPDTVAQQAVIIHQIRLGLRYRSLLWMLSKIVTDTIFLFIECLLVSTPVYLMCDMSSNFAIFVVVLWLLSACTSLFIRVTSLVGSRYVSVIVLQAVSGALVGMFVLLSGFLIPVGKLPFFWEKISSLSPFKNAYFGLLANEYTGKDLMCSPEERLPPSYTVATCVNAVATTCVIDKADPKQCEDCLRFHWFTLRSMCSTTEAVAACAGENAGYCPPDRTSGSAYLNSLLGSVPDITYCALTLFAIYLSLAVISMVVCKIALCRRLTKSIETQPLLAGDVNCVEVTGNSHDMEQTVLCLAVTPQRSLLDNTSDTEKTSCSRKENVKSLTNQSDDVVCWSDINYKNIVRNITGSAKRGTVTVVIGESGCGKTTFFRELGRQTQVGLIEFPAGPFIESDTVEECLLFAVMTRRQSMQSVKHANELSLEIASILGFTTEQLSEKVERLSELRRRILLLALNLCTGNYFFLIDEPTTGLKSSDDISTILRTLHLLASHPLLQCAVVCSLHQPTDEQLLKADKLLIVSTGRILFDDSPSLLSDYLLKQGCEDRNGGVQLSEWALHVFHSKPKRYTETQSATNEVRRRRRVRYPWAEAWKLHDNRTLPTETTIIERGKTLSRHMMTLVELMKRRIRSAWRKPSYPITRLVLAVLAPLLCGSIFWNLNSDQDSLRGYVSIVMISITLSVIHALTAAAMISGECGIVERERWMYNPILYAFSVSITELPLTICCSLFWWAILDVRGALVSGSETNSVQGIGLLMVVYGFFCYGISIFGIACSILFKSFVTSQCVITIVQLVWSLHSGFLIPYTRIPKGLLIFHFANPFSYYLKGVSEFIFHDTKFHCSESQVISVPQPFCNYSTTYEKDNCEWCPFTSGDSFLHFYGWSYDTLITDLLAILVGVACFNILILIAAKCYRYSK